MIRNVVPANQEGVLDVVSGNAMELIAEFEPMDAPAASMVELNVFRSPDKEECTRIVFFRNRRLRDRDTRGDRHYSMITIHSPIRLCSPMRFAHLPRRRQF